MPTPSFQFSWTSPISERHADTRADAVVVTIVAECSLVSREDIDAVANPCTEAGVNFNHRSPHADCRNGERRCRYAVEVARDRSRMIVLADLAPGSDAMADELVHRGNFVVIDHHGTAERFAARPGFVISVGNQA